MTEQKAPRDRKKFAWGIVLVTVGTLFFLHQVAAIDLPRLRHWWPAIFIVIGIIRMVAPEQPRQVASGGGFALVGMWLLACANGWYGLSYRNGWPLLLVIFGGSMVVGALLDRGAAEREGKEDGHA